MEQPFGLVGPADGAGRLGSASEPLADYAWSMAARENGALRIDFVTESFAGDFDADGAASDRLGVFALVHPSDRPLVQRGVELLVSGRDFVAEVRFLPRRGEARWMRVYARPVVDEATGTLVHVYGAAEDITERKLAELQLNRRIELLRETEEERRGLLSRLAGARVQPPAIPTGEDGHLQAMAAASRRLKALSGQLIDRHQAEALRRVDETVRKATERLRQLLVELRPSDLDREGLAAALWAIMEEARAESGLEYRVENRLLKEPAEATRVLVYRIAQEALNNVRKHARAHHAEALLEERDGGVFVRIWDDGLGFSLRDAIPPRPGQLGLTTMRERAETAGGWIKIDSLPALGTRIEFWVPTAAPDANRAGTGGVVRPQQLPSQAS